MLRSAMMFIALSIMAFCPSLMVHADCPDWVDCCTKPDMKYVGHLSVPTCYKFLEGCTPWHCHDQKYSHDLQCEWDRKCKEQFPKECGENVCSACFPTVNIDKKNCACGWTPCPQ